MKSVADVLRQIGWIHSAGGTGPYLSLRVRERRLTRQHIDQSVYRHFDVLEVPTVRESMMLVPREDAAVALAAGRRALMTRLKKLPIDAVEIDALADRILKIVGDGVRSAEQLRAEIPAKLITDLGEEGKKLGFGSTLPIALRLLHAQGKLTRVGEDLRLDAKRYFYRRWPKAVPVGEEPRNLDAELAERFVRWTAGDVDDFAFFAGIGKTAAKKALGGGEQPPVVRSLPEGVVLLPFRDPYFELHRAAFQATKHHNTIVAGGELRGIWEYDGKAGKIVWRTFEKTPGVEAALMDTELFIHEELGDHKFYSFDQGATREKRIKALKE